LAGKIIFGLPDDYFKRYIENINSVPLNDVNKAAAENIFPDQITTVLVGDKDKLLEQLKSNKFGEVKIYESEE
jgi:predicted Zn-dependent peptidase